MIKAGECESRIGDVDVVVSASVERNKSTIKIQFRLNHAESACEIEPTNAVPSRNLSKACLGADEGNQSSANTAYRSRFLELTGGTIGSP